jgi:hypothetical protein
MAIWRLSGKYKLPYWGKRGGNLPVRSLLLWGIIKKLITDIGGHLKK